MRPPRILVLGGAGQLAHDLEAAWPPGLCARLPHSACDVTDREAIRAAVAAYRPEALVSCAAFHRVDDCEREVAASFLVNAVGARYAAEAAAEAGMPFCWFSTGYVFSGKVARPYLEDEPPDPISLYGASKVAGEVAIRTTGEQHYIVRSNGLYGVAGASGKGGNFVETMLRLAREERPVRVVADQVIEPTFTADLAEAVRALLTTERHGTYHATNQGALSWHEFAAMIFELAGVPADLAPTTTAAFGAPARRPAYSVLANRELPLAGVPPLRPVRDALADYLDRKGHR